VGEIGVAGMGRGFAYEVVIAWLWGAMLAGGLKWGVRWDVLSLRVMVPGGTVKSVSWYILDVLLRVLR
jgi:hypothetical protein